MGTRMPSALDTETVVIQAPEKPLHPATGGPKGPPVDPFSRGRGGGGGDDDRPRKPSGMGMFGMRIALIPITVLFIATAFIYYVRSRTGINWRSVPMPSLLWLSTALILVSSWTLERARAALRSANYGSYARWLLRTLYLGLGFLASQALALQQLVTRGLFMRHNPHSSLFYVITGSHGAHLFGGLVALAYLLLRSRRDSTQRAAIVTALYWHFLAGLWVGLFLFLLLWK
jgi:cytochrome c oxidase subunit 3